MPAILLMLFLLLTAACGEAPQPLSAENALRRVEAGAWPLIKDDLDWDSLNDAAAASLDYIDKRPPEQEFVFGPDKYLARELAAGWRRVMELRGQYGEPEAFTAALKQEFNLYQAVGQNRQDGRVLFTGYYEPIIEGRLTEEEGFQQPLYGLPRDLLVVELADFGLPPRRLVGQKAGHKLKPYPVRAQIDYAGAVKDSAEALAWIADPVEAFFLQVQGSGQITLADGSRLRLGYAGANGRPYRSIGKLLLERGYLQSHEMSMQNIQKYLAAHPERTREVLSYNPSYVFFRVLPAVGGPLGAYGRPVTGGRSFACDRTLFPPMALAFISGVTPLEQGEGPLNRLAWAQDTGGAITGPGRLDLFYGSGPAAGLLAGRMKHMGQLYFLAPKR